jgi:hypothetical protein
MRALLSPRRHRAPDPIRGLPAIRAQEVPGQARDGSRQ